ncbi:MAG: hypothetical protein HWD61_14810 [Parachlamydiaceae bacterium]|nr:MAG: hypothetical protein HWD61_14810 [Parachlamydiaceae bacterium]
MHLKEPKVIHSYKISRYLDHFENQIEKTKSAFSTSLFAFITPTDFDRYQNEVKTVLASSQSITNIPLGKRQYIQSYLNRLENLKAMSQELQQTENLLKNFQNN